MRVPLDEAVKALHRALDRECDFLETHAADCADCAAEEHCEIGRQHCEAVDALLDERHAAVDLFNDAGDTARWCWHSTRFEDSRE